MIIQIDISGQIQQKNYDSAAGFRRSDGLMNSVFLRKETKKEIIKKYKGQVVNLIEKIHCILIYRCIKDYLENVKEIKMCKDCNPRRIKFLLPFLFKDQSNFKNIKINFREGHEPKSNGHRIALKTFRRRKHASILLTKENIENKLFLFK